MSRNMIRALIASAAFVLPLAAAGQGLETASITAAPSPRLIFSDSEMALAQAVARTPGLADFYGTNGLKTVFAGPEGAARRAALINAVTKAPEHGLPVTRYDLAHLRAVDGRGATGPNDELAFARVFARWTHDVTGGIVDPKTIDISIKREVLRPNTATTLRAFATDPKATLAGLEPQDPRYKALQKALGGQNDVIVPDGLPAVESAVWKVGSEGEAVAALRARLAAIGFGAGTPTVAATVYDQPLAEAVARYQAKVGVNADGVAGPRTVSLINRRFGGGNRDILISLERMRWLSAQDLGQRMVWVNLPEYNAKIVEGGQTVFETRVVIGKNADDFRTPEFSDEIEYMVVNPRWNVPRSITTREYLPRLQANRNAVSHIDIVDGNGNVIPRDRINFGQYTARNFPYRMRQKPSDDNALGLVKFMFPNPWNIYLHDTPTKHLFNNASRAYSHGCIRIGRPFDLAYELLKGTSDNPEATFQRALDSKKETYLNLKTHIPVHLVYFTSFPDDTGTIRHFPDVYGLDNRVYAAYEAAALETFRADE